MFVSDGLAVMSVDLGSEFMKIAIVKVMTVTDYKTSIFLQYSMVRYNWFVRKNFKQNRIFIHFYALFLNDVF